MKEALTTEQEAAIVAALRADATITAVQQEYGLPRHVVRAIARAAGIEKRPGPVPGSKSRARRGLIDEAQLRALVAQGLDDVAIGRRLRVTKQAVGQARARWGIERPRRPPPAPAAPAVRRE